MNYTIDDMTLNDNITNFMQQSLFWKTNRPSVSQETFHDVCKSKVCYLLHRRPPHVPVMSHINPVHSLATEISDAFQYFPSAPGSFNLAITFSFHKKNYSPLLPNTNIHGKVRMVYLMIAVAQATYTDATE